jgi:hypothetical protein
MKSVRDALPANLQDKRLHCLAAGGIALRCGVANANVAGAGKEFKDLFGAGDFSWADWRADRAGIRCARQDDGAAALSDCCDAAGY